MTDYLKHALRIYEVEIQLENDCCDENREMESFTLEEVKASVEYCIERMEMDLDQLHEDWKEEKKEYEEAKATIKQCKWWLNKFSE